MELPSRGINEASSVISFLVTTASTKETFQQQGRIFFVFEDK
jgi:hypothetical protein